MRNPANVEELFKDQHWKKRIHMAVSKFAMKEDVEDTVSEIFLLMLSREDPEQQGRDYIERWDSNKSGSFSNWVYTFVRNFCIKKWSREKSQGGRLIEQALSLVPQEGDKEVPDRGTIFTDRVGVESTEISTVDIMKTCLEVVDKLRAASPAHSWVEYHENGYTIHDSTGKSKFHEDTVEQELVGKTIRRDLATVLEGMVLFELDSADIAKLFKTSRQFVYTLVDRLRQDETLVELRQAI